MGLFRLYATEDTWITNTVIPGDSTTTLATGANLGANPTLQVYKVTSSFPDLPAEISRALINFDINYLSRAIYQQNLIPSSSVSYFLKAFDYPLKEPVPTSFDMYVWPISSSWDEGAGADYQSFSDLGWANWFSGTSITAWANAGGDYLSGTIYGSASMHFDTGTEDLEVDVTSIVYNWLSATAASGSLQPNGFMIKLGNIEESNLVDYYRKAFYSRDTHYVAKVPYLEARWNDVRKDNRKNFAYNQSSSLYFYNLIRGVPQDLPAAPMVRLQDNVVGNSASFVGTFSGSRIAQGIYSSSFFIQNTASFSGSWVDVWTVNSNPYMTGAFTPLILTGTSYDSYPTFVVNATNLKRIYRTDELAHIKVNVREKNYNTFITPLETGSLAVDRKYMENMFYSVMDNSTGDIVIPFSTGSLPYTQLSYNSEGNYMNLWMNSFVPGFVYRIIFLVEYNQYEKEIVNDDFLFKVI